MTYDVARVVLISDLYRRIAEVTTRYTFTAPVEASDIDTVLADLSAAVPGYFVAVALEPDRQHVLVDVRWPDGTSLYRRQMIVA